MPYIYSITNSLNGKIYIGKTLKTVEERWSEHCRDAKRIRNEKRPLYEAINKYGKEAFVVDILEEVDEDSINEKEKYWIEILGTFKNGYNATLGGDGKSYVDYDLIYSLFQEPKNIKEISLITKYDPQTIRQALERRGISSLERQKRGRENITQCVAQLDKETEEVINIFPSIKTAYQSLEKQHSGHIAAVCNGKRKSIYGFKWKYI